MARTTGGGDGEDVHDGGGGEEKKELALARDVPHPHRLRVLDGEFLNALLAADLTHVERPQRAGVR